MVNPNRHRPFFPDPAQVALKPEIYGNAIILLPKERRNQVNVDRAVKLLSRMLSAVDAGLEGREFLAGAFSGADVMTGHGCTVAQRPEAAVSDKPNVAAYIERLNARLAMQRAWAAM